MELLSHLALGFSVAHDARQPDVRVHRLAARHADRRAAGHRARRDHRHAAADDLCAAAGIGAHHARRHLLRRAIRWFDDVDPAQHAGRNLVRRDLPRRPPDGAQGPSRRGARDRRAGLVLRRDHRHGLCRDRGDPAVRIRAQVRARRVFFADGAGPDRRRGAGARLAAEGDRDDHPGPAARDRRHRRQFRAPRASRSGFRS